MAGAVNIPTFDTAFNLPVEQFILAALAERFPDLDIRPGSAIYQAVVKPVAFALQPFKDRLDILRRNQSLRFFQYMLPEELDRLVANYLVERKGALNANGTARVFFQQADNYTVPTEARFFTDDGIEFQPVTSIAISQAAITLNFLNGLYYLDVPVAAVTTGEDGVIDADQINRVDGVAGAVQATNPSAFFGGRDEESNAGLAIRTRRSIATRTITSPFAIEAILGEEFGESLISLEVIGYGDEEMIRDRVRSWVSFDEIFASAFARKLNVSIDANGAIDTSGSPPATNRYLGVVIDTQNAYLETDATIINDPYYFFRLPVVRNGETVRVAVNRGDQVRVTAVDQSGGPDPDDGLYTVVDIVYATPIASHLTGGGDPAKTMMLVLDRPFQNPQNVVSITAGSTDLVAHTYSVETGVSSDEFHAGGKADIYIHTTNTFTDELIISELFASVFSPTIFDVPVTDQVELNPLSQPWYEDGKVFQLPAISFVRVETISPTNPNLVLRTLEQGKDFIFISTTPEERLTPNERGVLRFTGSDLSGARVRVVYETNSDIQAVQDYVSDSERRDVTKSVVVRSARSVLVDVRLSYAGDTLSDDVETILQSYVRGRPQGGAVTVNEITALLAVFGVTDIDFPVTLVARRIFDDGEVEEIESNDRVEATRLERFTPRDELEVTKRG